MRVLTIYLIAGETSGDLIGARLMHALKALSPSPIEFHGIGGKQMEQEGLESLFPMQEISLMGFAEIVPHLPRLIRRIRQTVAHIKHVKPDIVVTIDSPGFNFRVAKKIRESGNRGIGEAPGHLITRSPRLVHYVAPSVWAYKPERAEKMAKWYDHVLALFPFEPPYFEKAGLPCTFVGLPVLETIPTPSKNFRTRHGIPDSAPLLAIMPGSRKGELSRMLPIFLETFDKLKARHPELHGVVIAAPGMADLIHRYSRPGMTIIDQLEKYDALAASTVALVKSGTSALEVAALGIPMIVAYRMNPLSAWLIKRMIRVKYVTLINLILDQPAIPEYLQEQCTPERLTTGLTELLEKPEARETQLSGIQTALASLHSPSVSPSEAAARVILELAKRV